LYAAPELQGTPLFIPSGAKNPQGAAKVIDFWTTKDFAYLSENGIEGYTYHYDNSGTVIKDAPNASNVGLDMELFFANMPAVWADGLLPRYIIRDNVVEVKAAESGGYLEKAKFADSVYTNKAYYQTLSLQAFPKPSELDRAAALTPDLNTYSTELLASLIMGEKSLNNWSTYMADLKRLGLDELITINQARLDRVK
jgi:hypothetical protein